MFHAVDPNDVGKVFRVHADNIALLHSGGRVDYP